ncbi:MAG: twin-arginine translocation signal domain-containing protein [Methylovulum sp.]|nr:MAG: twin-arginine translocation signal domain-containing protein [Methylovulum sp.]
MNKKPFFKLSRRQFLKYSATGSAMLGLSPLLDKIADAADRPKLPNLVLIVSDEERHWSRVESLIPDAQLATFQASIPGRMQLRNQGVRFHNYFTPTAPCSPARSVLFSGHHTVDNGVVDNMDFDTQASLDAAVPTMADVLTAAGYYCAYKGKVHLARDEDLETAQDMADRYGFLDWQGPFRTGDSEGPLSGAMRDDDIAGYAKTWLETTGLELRGTQKPFLLTVNFINPHDIMMVDVDGRQGGFQLPQGPNPTSSEYDPNTSNSFPLSSIPKRRPYLYWWNPEKPQNADGNNGYSIDTSGPRPAALDEWASMLSAGFGNISLDDAVTTKAKVYLDNTQPSLGTHEIEAPLWQIYLNYYLNCIIDNDRAVLKVLNAVKSNGFAKDTLVIFTADHGELALSHMGSSRFYEAAKTTDYETLEETALQPAVVMPLRQKGPFVYHENNQLPFVVARLTDKTSLVKRLLPLVNVDVPVLASSVDLLPTLIYWAGKNHSWYTQTFGAALAELDMLDHLPGVTLHNLLRDPASYKSAQWSDGQQGRDWVLFTADTLASSLDADYAYLAIWGQCSGHAMDLSKRGCVRGLFDGTHKYARYFSPEDYELNGADYAKGTYARLSNYGKNGQDIQLFLHDGVNGDLEIYNSAADANVPVNSLNGLLYTAMTKELARVDIAPATVQRVLDGDTVDACA